jgi:hypothetical protein
MTETTSISSLSLGIPQEKIDKFEKHTKGIGSKLLRHMGYDGQGLGKSRHGILSPIIATPWVKHKGLIFDDRGAKPITMKTIFVKDKDKLESTYSLGEGETIGSDGGNRLPP